MPDRTAGAPKLSGGLAVDIVPGTRLAKIAGKAQLIEEYFCNYEVDPEFLKRLKAEGGMQIAALGPSGEPRAIEIAEHPFYVATLFQPQRTSVATGSPHPIIVAYLQAAHGA